MPSLVRYSLIALAGCLISTHALPHAAPPAPPTPPGSAACSSPPSTAAPRTDSQNTGSYQPTTSGLPSNSGLQFKFAFVGLGVQNYSCATTTPASTGALATLFDATQLFSSTFGKPAINNISSAYLHAYEQQSCTKFGSTNVAQDNCEQRANLLQLPIAGHHYFANVSGKGVPTFDITKYNDVLSAKKSASAAAPSGAYAGANNAGAVDWLYLIDDGTGKSHGVKEVYRVETAGGDPVAGACAQGAKVVGVKYAAEYWFYY